MQNYNLWLEASRETLDVIRMLFITYLGFHPGRVNCRINQFSSHLKLAMPYPLC